MMLFSKCRYLLPRRFSFLSPFLHPFLVPLFVSYIDSRYYGLKGCVNFCPLDVSYSQASFQDSSIEMLVRIESTIEPSFISASIQFLTLSDSVPYESNFGPSKARLTRSMRPRKEIID